ncbi:toprim domain-containing protein [Chryseobacterium sp. 5_R23647]|uniref:toprim domain-containing protein n=1 Tax=Chryseobacterium sp. 5_R23647 TaxID=2258964 RepID=UPI000E23E1D5|nr:toprim domain-containing protein [Chryseobacterium sp. 5_R23647]REC42608.1 DNA primase [Chryseobacterium sp. 5_R23647]
MNCEKIKQKVGIRAVLESFGIFPVKENPKTAFYFAIDREEKIPSLSVDFVKNKAFDFGNGKSYDLISIVQQINKCSVSEALKYLSKLDFTVQNELKYHENNTQISNHILEIKEIQHPALIQYLKSRRVFEQKHRIKEIHYELKGRKFFGIGFQNNSGGFEIRNLHSKICLGKKDVTLIVNDKKSKNEIVVFEGFFDYLTYRNLENSDNSNCDCLVLNSTAMLFKVEEKLKQYEKISLFLDNDKNGKSVKSKIQSQYRNVEDCSLIYHDFKDLNEWFCTL